VEVRLVQGRVVWAHVPDPQRRNPKTRRCVVISPGPFEPDAPVELVPVTGTIDPTYPEEYVEMEYGPGALTKFTKRCAAHCVSVLSIPASVLTERGGIVKPKHVKQILERTVSLGDRVVRQSYPFDSP